MSIIKVYCGGTQYTFQKQYIMILILHKYRVSQGELFKYNCYVVGETDKPNKK